MPLRMKASPSTFISHARQNLIFRFYVHLFPPAKHFLISHVRFTILPHMRIISSPSTLLRLHRSRVYCLSSVHSRSLPDEPVSARSINESAARTRVAKVFTVLDHGTSWLSFTLSDMRLSGVAGRHSRGWPR
jgi:hypothetical protein